MHHKLKKDTLFILFLVFGIVLLTILSLVSPNDWFGWVIFICTFTIVLLSKTTRKNIKTFYSSLFILAVHQIIAVVNSYVMTVPGADVDAISFHNEATFISQFSEINLVNTGADLYVNFLALFYKLFGESIFLGGQLSLLAFTLSIILVLKISQGFEFNPVVQKYILLFFGLMPSMVIYTSITLRESFQVFFFLSICYVAIKLKNKKTLRGLILLVLCMFIFGMMHNGLLVLTPVLAFLIFYWVFKKRKVSVVNFAGLATAFVIMFGMFALLSTGIISTPATDALFSGEGGEYASSYRENSVLDARAAYGVALDTSSFLKFSTTFPAVVLNYFLAPFPWQMGSIMDIVTVIENFIRIGLIFYAMKSIKGTDASRKTNFKILFLLFILVEFMWAAGTVNWGTAMRHHIIAYPIILIIGGGKWFNIFVKNQRCQKLIQY